MSLAIRVKIFFIGTLLGNYLLRTPGLLDEYYAGRFILLTLLGLWACLLIFPAKKRVQVNVLDLTFFLFYIISAVSLFWAKVPSAGYFNVQTVLLTLVCYTCFRLFSKDISQQFLFRLLTVLSIITLVFATWDFVQTGLKVGLGGKTMYLVIGHSGHKNLLASFIFLLFGFNLIHAFSKTSKPWIYLLLGGQLLAILLLRSRAVYLALFVLFFMVVGYLIVANANSRKLIVKRILPLLLGGLIVGGFLFFKTGVTQEDWKRLNPTEYLQSASGKERLFAWYKTADLIEDKWVLGYGAGNWKIFFPSKSVAGSYRLQYKNLIFTRVHNDFLEVWAEQGILGFILFTGVFAWALYALFIAFKKSSSLMRRELIVLGGLLMGYMLISFLDFPKERFEHQVLLALLLARIVEKTPVFFQNERYSAFLSRKAYLTIITLFGLLLIINLPLGYFRVKGEIHNLKALTAQATSDWKSLELETKAAYSDSYQISPFGTSIKWLEGVALYHQKDYLKARDVFEIAMQQTPYYLRLLNDYAGVLVQLKDYEKAVELYLQALYINPEFEEGIFNLVYVYAQLHNFEEAFKWLEKTKTNPKKKADFIQELNKLKAQSDSH